MNKSKGKLYLVVGRVGYGQVAFIRPVDLTTLPSVDELLGGLVRLEDRNANVYPEEFEASKPPPGEGLNHTKRLRNLEGTEFVDFDAETGRWTFQVHEF
ncbi:hypothetical protein JCM10449v2_003974 [Rhodotorula kratochvilovae]